MRPLSFPHPRQCVPPDGDWQWQAPSGAPGTARQGNTRIIMLVNNGGTATQPRAPGHERPHAALCAARHGRLSAASTAPGADIPPATTAGAPGQYCQSAALRAPGHGRPLATTAGVPGHDRLSAAPIATVALPAGPHRLRQECLPHYPANPRTLIYPHLHRDTTHTRTVYRRATRYTQSSPRPTPAKAEIHPLSKCWRGGRVMGQRRTTPGIIRAALAHQWVRQDLPTHRPLQRRQHRRHVRAVHRQRQRAHAQARRQHHALRQELQVYAVRLLAVGRRQRTVIV